MEITEFIKQNKNTNVKEFQELIEPSIYFICNPGGKIIYIGSTINIINRIAEHQSRKEFRGKSVCYFNVPSKKEMLKIENRLIKDIVPQHNIRISGESNKKIKRITVLGRIVLKLIEQKGFKRGELAKKVKYKRQRIGQIIRSERIQLQTLKELSRGFDMPIEEMYIEHPKIQHLILTG